MKFKQFIYNIDKFAFAQRKFLRKWYSGQWTKISVLLRNNIETIDVWVKGEPTVKYEKIVKVENW